MGTIRKNDRVPKVGTIQQGPSHISNLGGCVVNCGRPSCFVLRSKSGSSENWKKLDCHEATEAKGKWRSNQS